MKKLAFSSKINASKEKVWNAMWNDEAYKHWASAFYEGAYAETDWKEGSKIAFLSPSGEGIASVITRKVPNELISFRHEGVLKNKKFQAGDPETKKWAGATENYTLNESNGVTTLKIDVDVVDEFYDEFKKVFPKALKLIKEEAESKVMAS